ncbi:MAG TPA: hypothetical protein VI911_11815 [Patescibacteria group bacterium]|nr:hypothetical protein [Patescibacteria group bacterium]
MKSTAKAYAWARDLKDKLVIRGMTIVESKDANAWPELTINTDQAYIQIEAVNNVSKDIFGQDLIAFAPHKLVLAYDNGIDAGVLAKIYAEVVKLGIKMYVSTDATLADAKVAAATEVEADIQWPTKGM